VAEEQDLDRVREAYDAIWKRGDVEAGLVNVAEDIEWITPQNPEGSRHGREDVARFFREFHDTFETIEITYDFTPTEDGRVVVSGHYRGRGRSSGIEMDTPLGQILTFRDGKGVRMEWFATGEKALEAAGLR
jgi:ketosteroid isomerase-like protein